VSEDLPEWVSEIREPRFKDAEPFRKIVEQITKEAMDNLAKKGISSPSDYQIVDEAYRIAKDLRNKTREDDFMWRFWLRVNNHLWIYMMKYRNK